VELATDDVGAFMTRGLRTASGAGSDTRLAGLDWALKDLFDVAGEITGYGNPDWQRTHGPAAATAPVVVALLAAGGRLVGRTKTVELAYGLTGENQWYGTPRNPRAPDRFPGGSSCGSAAAVAAGLVDFALGSDTGGSVRIPASYCGLYGMRPTHGAISPAGVCPLAPSFDTAGWFTRHADLLERVGDVVLPGGGGGAAGTSLLALEDAWAAAEPEVAAALAPSLARLEAAVGPLPRLILVPEGLGTLYEAFRVLQGHEAWASLGGWIEATGPQFGPGVAERFAAARAIPEAAVAPAASVRRRLQTRLRPLLVGGTVLVFPTSPCPAPKLTADSDTQLRVRVATLGVTALAGLAGLPEITLPAAAVGGAPVGLSLLGGVGSDRDLLALAKRLAQILGMD
jgi:amidase